VAAPRVGLRIEDYGASLRIWFGARKKVLISAYNKEICNMRFEDFDGSEKLPPEKQDILRKYVKQWNQKQMDQRRKVNAIIHRDSCNKLDSHVEKKRKIEAVPTPPLPVDALVRIFQYLTLFDLAQVMTVSKAWNAGAIHDIIWKSRTIETFRAAEIVHNNSPDLSWIDIFKMFSLTGSKETGLCSNCGTDGAERFEPLMNYLCDECPVPYENEDKIPVPKLKKLGFPTEEEIYRHSCVGPFRAPMEKTFGYNAWATITVEAYPKSIALAAQKSLQKKEGQLGKKKGRKATKRKTVADSDDDEDQ